MMSIKASRKEKIRYFVCDDVVWSETTTEEQEKIIKDGGDVITKCPHGHKYRIVE